ncbi:MAG TPA: ABC transporter ATP-binding protein [Kiritimatiellia bacterium]|nr:ABC transporter ATP-binding protein [Kiritimatiellia bacterium]HPJ57229.1 ABC transporter ATP-binding protein [Kiritimatiellia bacterium]HPR69109.1 ABC transporter ATP-binding protein [Kiritimatiellia bacterium]HRX05655.1 ABC transporter ATP-binding protein [Kiritimatiellia bacterium]
MPVPITIEKLVKRFGDKTVLRGIDVRIGAGELFFLLGPSGCGKTTLLRGVAGLNEPDEGRILAGDRDVTRLPPHQRDMGMVFQSYALWPHLSLRENVAFGLEMRGIRKSEAGPRVMRALDMVKLADRANAKPNELSGGQQQRVALARALVIEPQCLLLDEPLSNLDAKLRLEMRTEIRRICKEAGLTAIYVTHDQKEALSIADRLAILDQGRLLQVGSPQEVYTRPCSRFVAQFIGETTFIEGTVKSVRDGFTEVETAAGVWTASSPEKSAIGDKVWLSVRPEAVQLHTDKTGGPNVFKAQLHGTIYLGEVAQHAVELPGGVTLKALETRPKLVARDETRAETRVHIDPADVQILKE